MARSVGGNKGAQRRLRLPAPTLLRSPLLAGAGRRSDDRKSPSSNPSPRSRLQALRTRRRPIATLLAWASKGLALRIPLPGPKSGVRCCVQVRLIGGGRRGHAMRSRRRPDRLLQKTMNSQEFIEEERKAITGQTDPKQ
jgi:hypothetical protein